MEIFTLELAYRNQTKRVKCVQDSRTFIMDPDSIGAPLWEVKGVGGASFDPVTKDIVYYKDVKEIRRYNEANDPIQIALKPWLNNTPFVPDVFVEGISISDYTYFRKQRETYKKSLSWKLHQILPNRKEVQKHVNRSVAIYEQDIKIQRGVDISIELDTPAEDMEIVRHLRQRAFRNGQSKMPSTA